VDVLKNLIACLEAKPEGELMDRTATYIHNFILFFSPPDTDNDPGMHLWLKSELKRNLIDLFFESDSCQSRLPAT
jgi:hypothetical protein